MSVQLQQRNVQPVAIGAHRPSYMVASGLQLYALRDEHQRRMTLSDATSCFLGHNQTITPAIHAGDCINNAASGSAVSAAHLEVLHNTTSTESRHVGRDCEDNHPSSLTTEDTGHTRTETASNPSQPEKASLLTIIKDAVTH